MRLLHKRVKHYSLDEHEVALVRVLLKGWRDLDEPMNPLLEQVTASLEKKLK